MILEKRLVLFAFLLYFPCSLCNDDASQEATNSISHKKWNSGSMERHKGNVHYDFTSAESFTESFTSLASDSGFASSLGTSVNYNPESTENPTFVRRAFLRTHPANSGTDSRSTKNPANIMNDFESTDSFGNSVNYNFESTRDLTNYASDDSESTRILHSTSSATTEPGSTKNPASFARNSRFTSSLGSGVGYNPVSTEIPTLSYENQSPISTLQAILWTHPVSSSTDPEFNLTTNTSYESTIAEESTTRYGVVPDSTLDTSESLSSDMQSNLTTVSDINSTDNTISTTIEPTICDPVNGN